MKNVLYTLALSAVLFSCGDSKESIDEIPGKDLIEKISAKEEKLHQDVALLEIGQNLPEKEQIELVDLLNDYATTYPESKLAPEYLDKIHMIFSGLKKYELSIAYGDSVLNNYDDYVNRNMVIESIASTYDYFLTPRDTSKVRFYYEMLLDENPEMSAGQRKSIDDKLNNLDKSFEEIIQIEIAKDNARRAEAEK